MVESACKILLYVSDNGTEPCLSATHDIHAGAYVWYLHGLAPHHSLIAWLGMLIVVTFDCRLEGSRFAPDSTAYSSSAGCPS